VQFALPSANPEAMASSELRQRRGAEPTIAAQQAQVTPNGAVEQPTPLSAEAAMSTRQMLVAVLHLAKPCITANPRWKVLVAHLVASVGFTVLDNWVMIQFSYIKRDYNSALQKKDQEEFYNCMGAFVKILAQIIFIAGVQSYTTGHLSLQWKQILSNRYLRRYFGSNRGGPVFYTLQLGTPGLQVDNPDQRMTQDISNFVDRTVNLAFAVMDSVMSVIGFSAVLWEISADLMFFLVGYAIVGTFVTIRLFGREMLKLARQTIAQDADLRFALIRIREHAESVAFYGGGKRELAQALKGLEAVAATIEQRIKWSLGLASFNRVYKYFTFVMPPLIIAPRYFRDEVEFGVVAQSSHAFISILFSISLVVSRFEAISTLGAEVMRLRGLEQALDRAEEPPSQAIELKSESDCPYGIHAESVSLRTPNGKTEICKGLTFRLQWGQSLLIAGESGIGKSSLLRAFAGLWRTGSGSITIRKSDDKSIRGFSPFFLSQHCYTPLGSLREQVRFPLEVASSGENIDDEAVVAALKKAHLPLHERWTLDSVEDWGAVLSMGEQQRLAFARVFLHRPSLVFLDESTSAMDLNNENLMYEELKRLGIAFVSVGHRRSLWRFHDQALYGVMKENGPEWATYSISEFEKVKAS